MRYCADYHQFNGVTRKDPCIFTTLDLLSGYWQVEAQPEDREKTAVCTPEGLFEFNSAICPCHLSKADGLCLGRSPLAELPYLLGLLSPQGGPFQST